MSTKYKVYGFPLEILANQSLTSNYQKNNLARTKNYAAFIIKSELYIIKIFILSKNLLLEEISF